MVVDSAQSLLNFTGQCPRSAIADEKWWKVVEGSGRFGKNDFLEMAGIFKKWFGDSRNIKLYEQREKIKMFEDSSRSLCRRKCANPPSSGLTEPNFPPKKKNP